MKIRIWLIIFFCLFFAPSAHAATNSQFVTVVNPVRISNYNKSPVKSIQAQYGIIRQYRLPATWLLTYDSLNDPQVVSEIKTFNGSQELGIFLEVTPGFANKSGVEYRDSGSWHYATSVFLSGYKTDERIKLIDTVFEKFKQEFGKYPSSVGAWWVDSFSLDYMQRTYKITASIGCADQFSTDGYQLWGQYWSTPYYPSKLHAGLPASSLDTKLDVVNLLWAARDPVNGYYSSIYSTQDYFTTPEKLTIDYFAKLIEIYYSKNSNQFGQITVGLEGDFSPESYQGEFSKQMKLVSDLVSRGTVVATSMQTFSDWYRKNFTQLSPSHLIESSDILGSSKKATWYQSSQYRIGLLDGNIVDLRLYGENLIEPYYQSPNLERILHINTPSVVSVMDNKEDVWVKSWDKIEFNENNFVLYGKKISIPKHIQNSLAVKITKKENTTTIELGSDYLGSKEGLVVKDWTAEATHAVRSVKYWINFLLGKQKNLLTKTSYSVSQEELSALTYLKSLRNGRVLVQSHECLQCSWHSIYKPAAFSNKKHYVATVSGKPLIYSQRVFTSTDRAEAKRELRRLAVKYIYLVKSEDYLEKMPFSPGDLGVEMIYENANAQIWRIN